MFGIPFHNFLKIGNILRNFFDNLSAISLEIAVAFCLARFSTITLGNCFGNSFQIFWILQGLTIFCGFDEKFFLWHGWKLNLWPSAYKMNVWSSQPRGRNFFEIYLGISSATTLDFFWNALGNFIDESFEIYFDKYFGNCFGFSFEKFCQYSLRNLLHLLP